MTTAKSYGFIKEGKLHLLNKRLWSDLAAFPDCDVEILVKKRGKRSTQQNRYYWAVVVEEIRLNFLERGTRYTPEEIHEGLKAKFNPKAVGDEQTGEALFIAGDSTTEMGKEAFGDYIDRIAQWAAESLGLYIPQPNEQVKMFENE